MERGEGDIAWPVLLTRFTRSMQQTSLAENLNRENWHELLEKISLVLTNGCTIDSMSDFVSFFVINIFFNNESHDYMWCEKSSLQCWIHREVSLVSAVSLSSVERLISFYCAALILQPAALLLVHSLSDHQPYRLLLQWKSFDKSEEFFESIAIYQLL